MQDVMMNIETEARKLDAGDIVVRREGAKMTVLYVITVDILPGTSDVMLNQGKDGIRVGFSESVRVIGHIDPQDLMTAGLEAGDVIEAHVRRTDSALESKRLQKLADDSRAAADERASDAAPAASKTDIEVNVAPGVSPADVARRASAYIKTLGEQA